MKTRNAHHIELTHASACSILFCLLLLLTTWAARGQGTLCLEGSGNKFTQPPDNFGLDVYDIRGVVLADDFFCNTMGPITDIHIWSSWLNDQVGNISSFWIGIYSDVPAVTNTSGQVLINSHPGTNLLWSQRFGPTDFNQAIYTNGSEYFYQPTNNLIIGGDTLVWYYCFYPSNAFVQQGTPNHPTNYWLAVHADLDAASTNFYGWKTTPPNYNYNDPAVWIQADASGMPASGATWHSMTNPISQIPINLGFKLNTSAPQPCCPETNVLKYIQTPNVLSGMDVNATYLPPDPIFARSWVLADDFPCTNTGPITDIHVWGSWLNDNSDPNASYTLTIWTDVPTNATAGAFSHPGNLLWTQTYTNGQYTVCPYTNRVEPFGDGFFDQFGVSSNLYYYCFYAMPGNVFRQTGTATQPTNYWLSLTVQTSAGANSRYWGWKSSAVYYNDSAVAAGNGNFYPLPGDWQPIKDFTGLPLSMAFKVNTQTNPCPPPQLLCNNTNFECGTQWFLSPPGVIDQCCPVTAAPFPVNYVTNGTFCNQIIAVTWAYTNCQGQSAMCTQLVSIKDTTPPYFLMCSNYNITCGSPLPPAPMANDLCCGTNVTVSLLSIITNQAGCGGVLTEVYQAVDCCTNYAYCTQLVSIVASPPTLLCSNYTVNCNDPIPGAPGVIDVCCTNVQVTLLGTTTNNIGCNKTIYQTWMARDLCCDRSTICTQIVNVVVPPPQLLCSNVTITCGSPIPTNPPAVIDICCSNGVVVMPIGTTIRSNGCVTTISQGWEAYDTCCPQNFVVCTQVVTIVGFNSYVVPNANTATEGNAGNVYPFDIGANGISNMRYQQVYGSPQFGFVPPGGAYITAIAFRADGGFGGFSTTLPAVQVNLSTTAKAPDGLSTTFANNVGGDDTVVYFGALPLGSTGTGSPRAFDIVIPLSAPFFYNPAAGNLLLDVRNSGGGTTTQLDAQSAVADSVSRLFGGVSSTTGVADSLGLVTEFMLGPPIRMICSNINITCSSAFPTNLPTYVDFCCSNVTLTLLNSFTNGNGCSNIITQIWGASDCCGNVTNCSRNIVIQPSPPGLLCSNLTIQCGSPLPPPPTVVDSCCSNVLVTLLNSATNGTGCSNIISQTWRADNCCGQFTICSRTITVVDTTPPMIMCPSNRVVSTCNSNIVVTWTLNASDNCALGGTSCSPPSGTAFLPNTTNTVNCIAWDLCGNTNMCSFTITVVRPTISPLTITLSAGIVTVHWTDGILQSAPDFIGPWSDVLGASPPSYSTAPSSSERFFRLRCLSP